MTAAAQCPPSRKARVISRAKVRATSMGMAIRADIRRSPMSSLSVGVCVQNTTCTAWTTRSIPAPVQYRHGTIRGSVNGASLSNCPILKTPFSNYFADGYPAKKVEGV